ncbi:hypothetical protein Cgig2_017614 [Carnegiea gigantea]|uniref:Uncharacterized protein n=1 Tax=Carnegiea gigantea TaxID=171969 RepID=A0A9Q1Q9H6_9CARY|nr:hypothetical protein Cgig2_017614 [Carnegiea gigantea]
MNLFPNFANIEQAAEYVRDTFPWTLRKSSAPGLKPLPMDYHGLCPCFDLRVAARYAHNSNILKMVQAIFYVMVVDDAAALGLSCRLIINCMIWIETPLNPGLETLTVGSGEPRLLDLQIHQLTPCRQAALWKEGQPLFPPSETPSMRRNMLGTTSAGH